MLSDKPDVVTETQKQLSAELSAKVLLYDGAGMRTRALYKPSKGRHQILWIAMKRSSTTT